MARIKMPAARSTAKEITFEEAFHIFLTDSAARGLAEKTLKAYRTHLRDISHYFDISTPLGKLSRHKMNEMAVAMRESGLATNSIISAANSLQKAPCVRESPVTTKSEGCRRRGRTCSATLSPGST